METIRTLALSVCITAIATAVLSMLLPSDQGGMQRMLRFSVTAFFLTSLLVAFFEAGKLSELSLSTEYSDMSTTTLQEEADRQLIAITERNLAESLYDLLANEDLEAKKITVQAHITESGGIEINKVVLSMPQAEMERGKSLVEQTLGPGIEIILEE